MYKKLLTSIVIGTQFAAPALADETVTNSAKVPTTYLEIGPTVFLTELEGEIDDLLLEDNISLNAISLRGGVNVTEYLSIEADLALGTSGENLNETVSLYGVDGSFDGEVKIKYLSGIFAKGKIPLSQSGNIQAFARAGYVVSEIEASGDISVDLDSPPAIIILDTPFTVPGSYSVSGSYTAERSGPVGGGGIEFDVADNLFLRGEATYFGLENAPTVAATATIGFRF